jgi:DNA-binding winged helix-turn-helix (wHTH) protein
MGNPGESSPRKAFGEFELNLHTREVWVNGGKFDLQEQPFQVLCALLDRPSELVTREELTKRLWSSDTFVDYEHALNRVIKRLREALNDSAGEPRFIETLPRRGYRFIAPVRQVRSSDHSAESAPIRPDCQRIPRTRDIPTRFKLSMTRARREELFARGPGEPFLLLLLPWLGLLPDGSPTGFFLLVRLCTSSARDD